MGRFFLREPWSACLLYFHLVLGYSSPHPMLPHAFVMMIAILSSLLRCMATS